MSGAVAAHASYNGSGTQGLAVTNKISDANKGDVVSVFWNETDTTRQLLYGSSTLEIPTSGSGKNASWGGSQIFTVNNDIDCLGDIYLSVTVDMNTPSDTAPLAPLSSLNISPVEKFGWGYLPNEGASAKNLPIVKEAASQGVSLDTTPLISAGFPLGGKVKTSEYSYYVPANRQDVRVVGFDQGGPAGAQQPNKGARDGFSTTYNHADGKLSAILATNPGIYGGGYFKKLSPGEKHTINHPTVAGTTFQTAPPNGWAWVNDPALQILSLQIDDLHELVKYYNDNSYPVLGYAATTLATAGLPKNSDTQRPEGGCYMTVDDAIVAYNWYWSLITLDTVPDLLNLPQPSAPGASADNNQGPHWSALWRKIPENAVQPVSGVALDNVPATGYAGADLQYSSTGWGGSTLKSKVKFPLAKIIKRIEFQVGTQIWQTLEYNDLLSINATEMPESSYNRLGLQTTGYVKGDGTRCAPGEPEWTPGKKYQAFIPLPTLTKTLGPQLENFTQNSEDGYLMAAAPHQNVKIKIHYANFTDIWDNTPVKAYPSYSGDVVDVNGQVVGKGTYVSNFAHDWIPNATLTTKLFGQHMIMCNEEREQMKKMPNGIPKRLKMTQNVNTIFPAKIYPDQPIIVDLDHFSLYASHLVISADFLGRGGYGQESVPTLKTAELKLNSSSFSGQLEGHLLRGITNKSLGLYSNDFEIDKQDLDTGMGYYVFPLAARAYGGSSVPLNRFDNIRLSLTFTHPDITSTGYSIEQGTINVTCVGETTGLYKDGAASLAMY